MDRHLDFPRQIAPGKIAFRQCSHCSTQGCDPPGPIPFLTRADFSLIEQLLGNDLVFNPQAAKCALYGLRVHLAIPGCIALLNSAVKSHRVKKNRPEQEKVSRKKEETYEDIVDEMKSK